MSSRERWIIYPLLFFAFCLGARDQFTFLRPTSSEVPRLECQVIDAERINCKRMVASEGISTNRIESEQESRPVEIDSLRLDELAAGQIRCQQLDAVSPDGQRRAELGESETGAGRLTIFDVNGQPAITLAHRDDAGRLESHHADGTRLLVYAKAGGGTLVVLDADGQELGRWPVELLGGQANEAANESFD